MPDGLQQIVNWMLAKDPTGRYPTPDRAAQALQVFLAAGAESLHAPESDPKMRSLSHLAPGGRQQEPAAGRLQSDGPHASTRRPPPARRRRPSRRRPARRRRAARRPSRRSCPSPRAPPGEADKNRHASAEKRTTRRNTVPSTRCRPCRRRPAPQPRRRRRSSTSNWCRCRRRARQAPPTLFGPPVQPPGLPHLRRRRRGRGLGDVPRLSSRRARPAHQPPTAPPAPPERTTRTSRWRDGPVGERGA